MLNMHLPIGTNPQTDVDTNTLFSAMAKADSVLSRKPLSQKEEG